MAQGYYKIEGKPMAVACHGTVGLMHASMALYNAYCDRVPVLTFIGSPFNPAADRPVRPEPGDAGARFHEVERRPAESDALRRIGGPGATRSP